MRLRSLVRGTIRRIRFKQQHARYHFIHIPKNAGQSVRDALFLEKDVSLSAPYHYRYVDIAEQVGRHLTFFAVIRNPWSRTASRFHFGKQNAARWPANDPRRQYIMKATFTDYVKDRRILPIPEHPEQPWMGPLSSWFNQLEWLRDESESVRCDCLRMEHLEQDLTTYLRRPVRLQRRNVTKDRYDYRSMYSNELIDIVARIFRDDIEYFGFSFESAATRNICASN